MCHVLIIEDNFLIAEYLASIAEQAGATSIATASTEDEAIFKARECVPRLILSDVDLLAGSGPDAVKSIRSELGSIPVIFITGSPRSCDHCEPPVFIMAKPVDAALVTEAFLRFVPA